MVQNSCGLAGKVLGTEWICFTCASKYSLESPTSLLIRLSICEGGMWLENKRPSMIKRSSLSPKSFANHTPDIADVVSVSPVFASLTSRFVHFENSMS